MKSKKKNIINHEKKTHKDGNLGKKINKRGKKTCGPNRKRKRKKLDGIEKCLKLSHGPREI
jgi:hypothetical protein